MKNLTPTLLLALLSACSRPAPPTAAGPTPTAPATAAAAAAPARVAALAPAEAARALAQPGVVVLDVRTPGEFALGHLAGARNVNFRADDFAQQVARLDPDQPYVLYCASGNRSGQAAGLMRQQGFKHVANGGGYGALKAAGARAD